MNISMKIVPCPVPSEWWQKADRSLYYLPCGTVLSPPCKTGKRGAQPCEFRLGGRGNT